MKHSLTVKGWFFRTIRQKKNTLYINPVPSGLVLTGIVVSVSTTAFFLALTVRLYKKYNSLNLDMILLLAKKEKD